MTGRDVRVWLGLVLCLTLAACSLPRGAAFESEVLAAAEPEAGEPPADFAVVPVTRALLPVYAAWPVTTEERYGWIEAQPAPANRIIRPGDGLTITIWNTEENSLLTAPGQRFVTLDGLTVSSGGEVFLPYIGEVRVSGMSPERARGVIEERYLEVTPSAQVQVELREGRLSTVSLVGGVSAPGTYPLPDSSFTVLALLAEGGGVQSGLLNPQIRLMRGGRIYGTSVDRLYETPGFDTTLIGGDRVLVEEDERFFLSLGAAGREAVHPFSRDHLSALEALSIIGGVNDGRADPQGILVFRQYPSGAVRADNSGPPQSRMVFTLDLTTADGLFSAGQFAIRSGDLIYATESPVTTAQTVFGLLGSALGLAARVQ